MLEITATNATNTVRVKGPTVSTYISSKVRKKQSIVMEGKQSLTLLCRLHPTCRLQIKKINNNPTVIQKNQTLILT